MYLFFLIYFCLLFDWVGFVGLYMIFYLNLYRFNLFKILVILVFNKYFVFNGRVDILCWIFVFKIYVCVNNKIFIERYMLCWFYVVYIEYVYM